jgi:hypothetical protein
VLHSRYKRAARGIAGVFTSGRNVVIVAGEGLGSTSTLINDRTAARTVVSYPGCYVAPFTGDALGGPWLMFRCDQADQGQGAFELYDLSTGTWEPVAAGPQIIDYVNACDGDPACRASAVAVGADWIEWDTFCHGCTETFVFQNIATGQVQPIGWQPDGTTVPDLNSSALSASLCLPLRVPEGFDSQPGSLSFEGPFAVAFGWYSASGYQTAQIYVQRCGSSRRTTLVKNVSSGYPFGANASAVVAPSRFGSRTLDGLFFHGLRRFTMNLPAVPSVSQLALTPRHLYVLGGDGTLWVGPEPRLPKPATRRATG